MRRAPRQTHPTTLPQVPSWLDVSNPRVTLVPHACIFAEPSRQLPTFNSLAIQACVHCIPGGGPGREVQLLQFRVLCTCQPPRDWVCAHMRMRATHTCMHEHVHALVHATCATCNNHTQAWRTASF
jgi:hypothetical protein